MRTLGVDQADTRQVLSIMRMMQPYTAIGMEKTRLGRFFDGGYVMIDDFSGIQAAYSFGINDDVSWDTDIANMGIPVYQYDHTIDRLPAPHPMFSWKKMGIGSIADPGRSLTTVPDIIDANGHGDATDLILKCDIEGFEWFVLADLPSFHLNKFRQIVLEIHCFEELGSDSAKSEFIRRSLVNLNANHRLVHVHGNNGAPFAVVGGIPMPCVLEVTYLRKDRADFVRNEGVFPTSVDMPCNPDLPEYYLGKFEF